MTIGERLAKVRWVDNHIFETEGMRFYIDDVYGDTETDLPSVVLAKTRAFIEAYAEELGDAATERVLEFGIWQGGSALALASLFGARTYACVDICEPVETFEALRAAHPLGRRIAPYYRTSQDDADAVAGIVAEAFAGEPADVIIDDASHDYEITKRTFEHAFRHLRRGGWYVIEDWAWAHYPAWSEMWSDRPALTNLVLRLGMVTVSRPDLFDRIVVRPHAVYLQKGEEAPMDGILDLDACYELSGRNAPLF